MSKTVKHRYEFMFIFDCENGNPNGDPDAGNTPRIDPQDMHGLVSDVAIKRRIRNFVQMVEGNKSPNSIYIQNATNLNTKIAKAHEEANGAVPATANTEQVGNAKDWMCKNFFDVRTFGAVMSTGANAGQVRGPVQIAFAKSEHPIMQLDISMTRMAVTDKLNGNPGSADYEKWESEQSEDKMRTFGRKSIIPYGLFVGKAFVSAHLADQTGFSADDLKLFVEALLNMYEHDRSSSKGMMTTRKVYAIKHVGTDTDIVQRERQAKLGCCPAQLLFEDVVKVSLKDDLKAPRKFSDYVIDVDPLVIPSGVEFLEFPKDIQKLD
jgi:CRISPR-associated protein Csd2